MLNKKIKINFCGFWGSFDPYNNLFTNILKRHFSIEISDDPDFVFVSNRGMPFEYTKYKCVRIIFMGENISPDFTAFDYAIGFDNIQFGDRYFRLPLAFYSDTGNPHFFNEITYEKAKKILEDKKILL